MDSGPQREIRSILAPKVAECDGPDRCFHFRASPNKLRISLRPAISGVALLNPWQWSAAPIIPSISKPRTKFCVAAK
jgi:hypothetical protein